MRKIWLWACLALLAACGSESNSVVAVPNPPPAVVPPTITISSLQVDPASATLSMSWQAKGGAEPYKGFAITVGGDTVWTGMLAPASADIKRFKNGQYAITVLGRDAVGTSFAATEDIMIQNVPVVPDTVLVTKPSNKTASGKSLADWLLSGDASWKLSSANSGSGNIGLNYAHGVLLTDPLLNGRDEYQSFVSQGWSGVGFSVDSTHIVKTADSLTVKVTATFDGQAWDLSLVNVYFQKVEGSVVTDRAGPFTLKQLASVSGPFQGINSLARSASATGAKIMPIIYWQVNVNPCDGGGVSTATFHVELNYKLASAQSFSHTAAPVSRACSKK